MFTRSHRVAHLPYPVWVDHLVEASSAGRVRILHEGGYPSLFHASGTDIKANFANVGSAVVSELEDKGWYLVEAWDQS